MSGTAEYVDQARAFTAGAMQRRHAAAVARARIGAGAQQDGADGGGAARGGHVQQRDALGCENGVGVCRRVRGRAQDGPKAVGVAALHQQQQLRGQRLGGGHEGAGAARVLG